MDPQRLLEEEDHPAARALLSAALDESPPRGAARRAMIALGVATAGVTVGAGATAATAAAKHAFSLAAIAKWFAGGALLGVLAAGGAVAGTDALLPRKPAPQPVPAPTAAQFAPQPAAGEPRTLPESELEPSMNEPTAPGRQRAQRSAKPAPPPSVDARRAPTTAPSSARFDLDDDPLTLEVRLLDQARRAIASGDGTAALSVLDRYRSEHPRGRLAPEAFVLRLEALVRAGRAVEARQLAERRLAADPTGAHAERIRKITGAP
jgi:hypothetical protein